MEDLTLLWIITAFNYACLALLWILWYGQSKINRIQNEINRDNLEWMKRQQKINIEIAKELEMNQVRYKLSQN
jgi:hypothetical protein